MPQPNDEQGAPGGFGDSVRARDALSRLIDDRIDLAFRSAIGFSPFNDTACEKHKDAVVHLYRVKARYDNTGKRVTTALTTVIAVMTFLFTLYTYWQSTHGAVH